MTVFDQTENMLPKPNYEYITKEEDARRAMNEISKYDTIEVDTEGTGLDPYTSRVTLFQVGIPDKAYVFDNRSDTEYSDFNVELFKPILQDKSILKILQNAVYDMKMIKCNHGFYIENIYDTMLTEQLLTLGLFGTGLMFKRASLKSIVERRLGLGMPKEPRSTFLDYNQDFKPFQLEYAANDVTVLSLIRDLQLPEIAKHGFEDVCRLEFEFTKPMCEMELNGITFDIERQRRLLTGVEKEAIEYGKIVTRYLDETVEQQTLFGVSLINIDSNVQLKRALNKYGLDVEDTQVGTLEKYKGVPVIDGLLDYRKAQKFISTYGETLIAKVHPMTGRLHTDFTQMVSTGRMSSKGPNLQNIPKKQKYRTCFTAKPGYKLITSDMSGAELRILGNLSHDAIFIECYANGIDLHSRTAAEVNGIDIGKVNHDMRGAAKAINFGLCYGLSKFGLARRLSISENAADKMITTYFDRYSGVKRYLDDAARNAVRNRYSSTITGRKRFYRMPEWNDPDRKSIVRGIERAAKNAGIQGCLVADTKIKAIGNIGNIVDKRYCLDTGFYLDEGFNSTGLDFASGVYSGEKDVYNLVLSNGVELGITLNHEIPTVSKNSAVEIFRDVAVENLSKDDLMMIPLNVVEGRATDLSGYKYKKGHWRETFVDHPLPNVMDSKLAFVIGCLIGDGSYTKHNHFRFICPANQSELFDKFNTYIEDLFGYKPIEDYTHKNDAKRKELPFSQVSSVVIRGFLKHIGLDYIKHHDKKVPDYFYTETIENKGALLNGLFSTDGGFTIKSGPNFTTVSKNVADMVHQLLFSLGINSNLKTYKEEKGTVYRLQIPKRFNSKFRHLIGFSIDSKQGLLLACCCSPKFGDDSIVPEFVPKTIEKVLRRSTTFFTDFTTNEKAHLRRFKLGKCSYTSWREFYNRMPMCKEKKQLRKYLDYDFCTVESLEYRGKENTYDLICDKVHYFTANGIVVHNSNADTIKQAMIYLVKRLEEGNYDAKLVLTVHDEVVVECREDQVPEVKEVVSQSLVDGFGKYFSTIPMEADSLVGPCWLKSECENDVDGHDCGGLEMVFDEEKTLRCKSCGGEQ